MSHQDGTNQKVILKEWPLLHPDVADTASFILQTSPLDLMITSILRESPTHKLTNGVAMAIDLAPRHHDAMPQIEGRHMSVRLPGNLMLIGYLTSLFDEGRITCSVFLENDHLHLDAVHYPGVYIKDRIMDYYPNEKINRRYYESIPFIHDPLIIRTRAPFDDWRTAVVPVTLLAVKTARQS